MTKKILFGLIFLIFFLFLNSCSTIVPREVEFRPITLHILDSETGIPLQGIQIIVINSTLNYIPMIIDSISGSEHFMYKYMTDENGIVEIPQFSYYLARNSFMYEQRIIMNLEHRQRFVSNKIEAEDYFLFGSSYVEGSDDRFNRINFDYKAGTIIFVPGNREFTQSERYISSQNFMFRNYPIPEELGSYENRSFYIGHETIIFLLDRFDIN